MDPMGAGGCLSPKAVVSPWSELGQLGRSSFGGAGEMQSPVLDAKVEDAGQASK